MQVRILMSTGAAVLAAAGIASATGVGASPDQIESAAPQSENTPAARPRSVQQRVTPMTAEDRAASRARREAATPRQAPAPHFAALRRAATASDALPGDIGVAVGTVDRQSSRLVLSNALASVRLVATDRELCTSSVYKVGRDRGATDSCVPSAIAARQGAWSVTQCSSDQHPQRRFIAGAAPDGVRSVRLLRSGEQVAIANVSENGFAIETDEPTDAIEMNGTSTVVVPLPPVAC